ncbi:hypothetical protein JSE7799_03436 [Jannaschia seosinensis]|uniref:LPS-assembly lipoprotein n=1 Tax=Jannaschia seosinensis TaxID=313367 RepID=A0A0M7BE82_9RHOB|nr:LPS assembly lipoprotein LptE [Jannaschia seosinensis]CUH40701.1 hypothetical protein JSE7799_03436 [Jannaschia seosinensis]
MALRRGIAGVCLAGLLAACGFTPVYGPGGEAAALRSAIVVTEPDTRIEFAFTRRFEERLGQPGNPRYALIYTLLIEETGLAIDDSNNIERFNIEGVLDWALIPEGADAPVLTGQEVSFTAYSATGSTISTLESERDAERRLAAILADAVVTRLLAEAAMLAP